MTRKGSGAAMAQRLGRGRPTPALSLEPVPTAKRAYDASNRPRVTTKASGARGLYDTAEWKRESKAFLVEHPICSCGCGQRATIVDHVVPWQRHAGGFWDKTNWQPLSHPCHARKIRIEMGEDGRLARVKRTGPKIKGCFVDGTPRDPEHPWYTGGPDEDRKE